uniref:Uncharacterized protein n=1 Tax=Ditylenchus dipsaci TaxID=166011 RepID=A0A915EE68_9BILA
MKQCVCDQVNIMAPDEAAESSKEKKSILCMSKAQSDRGRDFDHIHVAMQDEDPLIFWSNNEKVNQSFDTSNTPAILLNLSTSTPCFAFKIDVGSCCFERIK